MGRETPLEKRRLTNTERGWTRRRSAHMSSRCDWTDANFAAQARAGIKTPAIDSADSPPRGRSWARARGLDGWTQRGQKWVAVPLLGPIPPFRRDVRWERFQRLTNGLGRGQGQRRLERNGTEPSSRLI